MAEKWKFLSNAIKIFWNLWSEFEIILQECSLGDPFHKIFKKFQSVHKHGSGKWGFMHFMDMKKFSSLKHWSDFEIISQERLLGDCFQNLFAKF